jgi:hypothetical protein
MARVRSPAGSGHTSSWPSLDARRDDTGALSNLSEGGRPLLGLPQGGIVPSYAPIVRDCFPAREAGARISQVLMATVAGMAIGGWRSGAIYA